MGPKEYKQRERRYVPEFVEKRWPVRVAVFYNMAIGPAPVELQKKYPTIPLAHLRRWRFWIDAVVVLENRMILIEGKLRRPQEGLGQLLLYKALLPQTPEMDPYKLYPVEMVLVVPREDPRVIAFAQSIGIKIEIYRPPWVVEYLKEIGFA